MDEKQKPSWMIPLFLIGVQAPLFLLHEHQDCYPTKVDCDKDWGGECEASDGTEQNCRYLGRSRYTYRSGGYSGSMHSTGSISRGGFGAIGHAMSGGG